MAFINYRLDTTNRAVNTADTITSTGLTNQLIDNNFFTLDSRKVDKDASGNVTIGGTLTVTGALTASSNLTVTGDLTVNGTTTTINATTVSVDDKNIELGSVATPTNATADGGGITLLGGTDGNKTFNWLNSTSSWTSSENLNLITGKTYKIAGNDVLTATQVLGKTLPAGTVVGTTDAQILTNKTITGTFSGPLTGNVTGNVTGNADTATKLATARTINGQSFDGTANISFSTTAVSEGTNLYYTDARVRAALSFTAGSGAYNSTSGVITIPTNTNQLTNGAGFATTTYVDTAVAGKDNTDEITEGSTNLYFTNTRARAALSFTAGSGAYNSASGVITIPTNTNQLTNGAGYVTSSGVTSVATGTGLTGGTITTTGTISIDSTVATLTGAQTLTNKTLTLPTIGGTGATFNGSTSGTTVLKASATAGTTTITMPATTGTMALTSDLPTVNSGALTLNIGTAAATNNTVTVITGTGFNANSASGATYQLGIGPALTALASTMTGAGTGFIRKNGADTYSIDTNTYLTGNQSITLTGDVTGTGTTSIATTLATVNSNVGTWNNVTVNAKGLVTSASNVAYATSAHQTHYIGTTQVQASSTNQALSGITTFTLSDAAPTITTNHTAAHDLLITTAHGGSSFRMPHILIQPGTVGSSSSGAGKVAITGGSANAAGTGGAVEVIGGSSNGTQGNGGTVYIRGGRAASSTSAVTAGSVYIDGGLAYNYIGSSTITQGTIYIGTRDTGQSGDFVKTKEIIMGATGVPVKLHKLQYTSNSSYYLDLSSTGISLSLPGSISITKGVTIYGDYAQNTLLNIYSRDNDRILTLTPGIGTAYADIQMGPSSGGNILGYRFWVDSSILLTIASNGNLTTSGKITAGNLDLFTPTNTTTGGTIYLRNYVPSTNYISLIKAAGTTAGTQLSPLGGFNAIGIGGIFIEDVTQGDYGGIGISGDACTIWNSGDQGYLFRIIDEDQWNATAGTDPGTSGTTVNNGIIKLMLDQDGALWIKSNFQSYGSITASGNVTAYSDARLKTNVQTIENSLDKTLKLRGVSYERDGKKNIGVIAQEIREILPEVVHEADDEQKTLSVSYGNVVGLLIEAIKELNAKVEDLQNQLVNK